jgi:hypothetical protein
MDEYESLSHTIWDCKYHVVFPDGVEVLLVPARRTALTRSRTQEDFPCYSLLYLDSLRSRTNGLTGWRNGIRLAT